METKKLIKILGFEPKENTTDVYIKKYSSVNNYALEIDFDSKTKNLKDYALFLQKIRTQLPQKYQLSITGLLDWSNVKDTQTLDILAKNIDELVIQSYQGNHTVSNYLDYLKRVTALKLPYKAGLLQHGLISKHHFFETDVNFKGYVVFLLRSKARS